MAKEVLKKDHSYKSLLAIERYDYPFYFVESMFNVVL